MRLDPIMRHSRTTQTPISPWFGLLLILLGVAFTSFAHSLEQITYYHNDALGSPVAATDATGNLIWQESYLPYGQRQTYESRETDCSSGICVAIETQADEKVWYTGKFEETRLGLVYLGARWYDPEIGRFLSVDPVSYNMANYDSFNRYAYANNNPYYYVDPNGESALAAFGGLIYESGQFLSGNGFNGSMVFGALKDGYNGSGGGRGFAGAAFDDATSFIPAGLAAGILIKGARLAKAAKAVDATKGLGNPFKNKTAKQIDEMFTKKGFEKRGPDPANGTGGYVNPKTNRSYHIDPKEWGKYREPNHVDVNRAKSYGGALDKKKLPFKE